MTQPIFEANSGNASKDVKIALAVEVPLMVLAVSTVILRVYSRLAIKRKIAPDDILIMLGTAAAVARTVISCMSADDSWSYDRKGPDRVSEIPFYQHIFERRVAYIFAVTFTRFSVLAYYLRIFPPGVVSLRRCCYILLFLALAHFIEVLTVLIVLCEDISKLWTRNWLDFTGSQCFSSAIYSYSAAIGDSIVDSLIFALPIPYVWQLSKLRIRQRLGLVLIFGLGFTVCIVALLQIPFIKRREGNMRYFGSAINILIAIQISFAIIAASLPDLRALIARSFAKFSPLHHRSLATACSGNDEAHPAGRNDIEHGVPNSDVVGGPCAPSESKRLFRKPDWMRNSIPQSLMSTVITHSEIPRLSTEDVSSIPQRPEKAAS
ncbi:hypothetical protein ACET3X_002657 [Alternaria dauci]|uniref:Rhodopsin domain-containing protein n=1 Tax=Alternaria dauci TaxID=48095 RepID=A0ABR3URD3_9PLEO